jgi:hypothetical protein
VDGKECDVTLIQWCACIGSALVVAGIVCQPRAAGAGGLMLAGFGMHVVLEQLLERWGISVMAIFGSM